MSEISRRSLLWALDRLALYYEIGKHGDPHLRAEARHSARVTLEQLSREAER